MQFGPSTNYVFSKGQESKGVKYLVLSSEESQLNINKYLVKKRHEEGGETKTIIKGDFIYGWSLINFNERQSCYQYDLEFCQNCVNYKVRKFYLSLGSKYKKKLCIFLPHWSLRTANSKSIFAKKYALQSIMNGKRGVNLIYCRHTGTFQNLVTSNYGGHNLPPPLGGINLMQACRPWVYRVCHGTPNIWLIS